ncbi:trimethylamine methyltransferase family protein [Pikeienuella piscinae]|uniref:Methyltransferase n=1 Tax=Pikeienuella piscinae TaxID=2748098 RepID=A0A7L5BZ14_9RHOB|nr:trimethylamine methyltransferase family protein [Pikeienuella piscinae]QIE55757.1 trimethylamine methyltransferase family protein [Pikeienuella piscinae]
MDQERAPEERRGRRGRRGAGETPVRAARRRGLRNPFTAQRAVSDDEIESLHRAALTVLENLGLVALSPEARAIFRAAGALVDEDSGMVRIGREIVEAALAAAPSEFIIRAGAAAHDLDYAPGALLFGPGAGCPNATDRERGRRPGSFRDFEELTRLAASFDAIHFLAPMAEPQDIAPALRHYAMTRCQLATSPKVAFTYSRGRAQVEDCFRMLMIGAGLDEAAFRAEPRTYTVINTNSPRQIDRSMAEGIIDHARWGQVSVITPFCLLGAMAPVTVAGALTLQHAEALAGVTLAQLAAPGAPVVYGNFASNVDMRSGAPAFGTPEHVKATLGAGQLARRIGLPWRASVGTSTNMADAQGAAETAFALWAAVLAGANMVIHSAGWLEGGLTHSYEKLILDIEMLESIAELCAPFEADEAARGLDAIAEVAPGGHFFAAAHTMTRYRTAFHEPIVAGTANLGQWTEAGAMPADARATSVWKARLAAFEPDGVSEERLAALDKFITRRTEAGGAPPGE